MTINEIRAEWEKGLTPLSVMEMFSVGQVLVILEDPDEVTFHCHRYFRLGPGVKEGVVSSPTWECSADGSKVPLEAVFSWLNDPSASSASMLEGRVKPEPVEV